MQNQPGPNYAPLAGALATALGPAGVAHFAIPADGVQFSGAALTVTAFVLGVMAAAVQMLLLELLKSKNEQISELKLLARRGTDITEKALERTAV